MSNDVYVCEFLFAAVRILCSLIVKLLLLCRSCNIMFLMSYTLLTYLLAIQAIILLIFNREDMFFNLKRWPIRNI